MKRRLLKLTGNTLPALLTRSMALVALFSIIVLGYMIVSEQVYHFSEHALEVKVRAEAEKRETVRLKVGEVLDFIRYKQHQVDSRIMDSIRGRTEEAHAMALSIYEGQKGEGDLQYGKEYVLKSLLSARFNNGRGYYFVGDMKGEELYGPDSDLYGSVKPINLKNSSGSYVVREMIDLVEAQEEGFYYYRWRKPQSLSDEHRKVSYVKYFEPFDWFIGSGEYLSDMRQVVQDEVLERLNQMTFGNRGHVMVFNLADGSLLTRSSLARQAVAAAENEGLMLAELLDKNLTDSDGFTTLSHPALGSGEVKKNVYYVGKVREWGWLVTARMSIDDIDRVLEKARLEMREGVAYSMVRLGGLLLMLVVIIFYISFRAAGRLEHELEAFKSFFRRAVDEPVGIDPNKLAYDDFKHLAESANSMIATRQKLEQERRQSEELYRGLVEVLPDGVVTHDNDGRVNFVNASFSKIYGWQPENVLGKTLKEVLPEDSLLIMNKAYGEVLTNDNHLVNTRCQDSEGRLHDIQLSGVKLLDEKGSPRGSILIHRDITEFRRNQEEKSKLEGQIYHTQKLESLGVLAGGIAHDFNNVLMPIMGYVELALDEVEPDSQVSSNLQCVMTAAERARDLVNQILVFSRQNEDSSYPIHLSSLIKEATQLLRASLPASIEIAVRSDAKEDLVYANPSFIHQILMNLATNAGHAMETDGGTLTISLENLSKEELEDTEEGVCNSEVGGYVRITVQDTGEGMPPDVLERIFDPYFTTKGVGEGSGMGLAVVHGIVTKLGGAIHARSDVERGSTFYITIPLVSPQEASEDEAPGGSAFVGTERVLFVDDEELVSHFWAEALKRLGYNVTSVSNSQEALSIFTKDPGQFDVVVTDQTMPDITGLRLSTKMLELRPDIPVILYTGYSKLVDRESALAAGVSEFLMKPLSVKKMGQALRKVLDVSLLG